jgi:Flp pilus assembly protein CpaB
VQDGGRRRARLILIFGIVLALGAGVITFVVVSGSKTETAPVVETVEVVVAAREIPAKTTLTKADLKIQQINKDAVPPAAIKKDKEDEMLIGKVTLQMISIGEPLLTAKIADPKNPAFSVIPANLVGPDGGPQPGSPNFRAMSLTVPDANAVGGTILPGDIIDILVSVQIDPTKVVQRPTPVQGADTSVKIVLERVTILARTTSVYTIRIEALAAERLAYLQGTGGVLNFLLRAPKDERASGSTGATFGDVYNTFRIKIPEKINP